MTDEELHQRIDELWEWACAVLPVFGNECRKAWGQTSYMFEDVRMGEDLMSGDDCRKILVEVLTDPNHEGRLTLALDATFWDRGDKDRFDPDDEEHEHFREYILDRWHR